MNAFCIFLTIILQLVDHALSELLGQPNTTIPSSSSQPLVPVGSNLEEIRLKQVNYYSFCWPIPLLFGKIRFMPPQLRKIGFHVQNHATQWHGFQHEIQFQEVGVVWIQLTLTLLSPSAILTLSSFQAQKSLDNSIFSFQIGSTSQEEGEETSSADPIVLSDETKAKLQESLQFLNQDIGQLIKNAQPI